MYVKSKYIALGLQENYGSMIEKLKIFIKN